MKRPKGMPKWKWNQRNDPPAKQDLTALGHAGFEEMKQAGVEWVEWITAGVGDECRHCLAMSGKVMRISEVPFLEHPDCEHEMGCRCMLIAVAAPDNQ